MYLINETNRKEHEYPTYGRQFCTYKWYKPLIFAAVMGVIYAVLLVAMTYIMLGEVESRHLTYLDLDFGNLKLAAFILGTMAVAIPALFIASRIVRDRPFSSYTSARGGWSFKVFLVGLLAAAVTSLLPRMYLWSRGTGLKPETQMTAAAILIVVVIGSLQCIAEEYLFRGVFMQTLGSWTGIPAVAVLLQAAAFTVGHSYDIYGMLTIFISGAAFGAAAWITRGIEAPCAMHILNNVPVFYRVGAGLVSISGNISMKTLIINVSIDVAFVLVLWILRKKTHLFDEVRRDDLAEWNSKHQKVK
jgi:membrane protease YdiL (CAAX protease family)